MSTAINTNTTAFMAELNLNANTDSLSNAIEQLSTGLQINNPSDNPAGYVISQGMNAQLTGIQQATSNVNDAVNETKTAEGALTQVTALLTSMRQLAVQASNLGVNDSSDVAADQAQIASAIQSINNISATTQFASKYLLDGSGTSATTTTAGSTSLTGSGLTELAAGRWTSGDAYTYNQNTVTAATNTTAIGTGSGLAATFGGNINIDGVIYSVTGGSSLTQLNTDIAASGYTAAAAGNNIELTSSVAGAPASTETFNLANLTGETAAAGAVTFANGAVTQGSDASLTLSDGVHTLTSVATTPNGTAGNTFTFSNGLVVSSPTLTGAIAATTLAATAGSSTAGQTFEYQIGANEGQTIGENIQSTAADQLGLNTASYTDANGNSQTVDTDSVADINLTTFKGAQDAIAVIDNAINQISTLQSQLGAFQTNVLQSQATSLGVAQQNLSSSKSTITDADLASTVVDYTKDQILVQSATQALTYATQMPQYLLKLLQ